MNLKVLLIFIYIFFANIYINYSQNKRNLFHPDSLEILKEEINKSFIEFIQNEKIYLLKRDVDSNSNYVKMLKNKLNFISQKKNGTIDGNYYYFMDDILKEIFTNTKYTYIDDLYLISFRSDKGDEIRFINFAIVNSYSEIDFYGYKPKKNKKYFRKNSFGFNFEQFFLNLNYSYENVNTTFLNGLHSISIVKIEKYSFSKEFKITSKISHTLLPFQEIYISYLLGIKKDFSFKEFYIYD